MVGSRTAIGSSSHPYRNAATSLFFLAIFAAAAAVGQNDSAVSALAAANNVYAADISLPREERGLRALALLVPHVGEDGTGTVNPKLVIAAGYYALNGRQYEAAARYYDTLLGERAANLDPPWPAIVNRNACLAYLGAGRVEDAWAAWDCEVTEGDREYPHDEERFAVVQSMALEWYGIAAHELGSDPILAFGPFHGLLSRPEYWATQEQRLRWSGDYLLKHRAHHACLGTYDVPGRIQTLADLEQALDCVRGVPAKEREMLMYALSVPWPASASSERNDLFNRTHRAHFHTILGATSPTTYGQESLTILRDVKLESLGSFELLLLVRWIAELVGAQVVPQEEVLPLLKSALALVPAAPTQAVAVIEEDPQAHLLRREVTQLLELAEKRQREANSLLSILKGQ